MLEIGSLIDGKYKILNKVGQGGMSVVYLAMNERANKQWAVKEVRKDGVLNFESVKQGLVAETDILKKLSHKHLPSIIDVIDTDDSFIIIMDYVQGNSLDKALKEFGAQPQEDVIEWSKQLCDVLGYLHTREPAIIYRDMKPANVMLKPDGNISLIDFGTAREHKEAKLEDTTCLGTRGYAAPEQYGGMGQTDGRTDIYCLGATMYHLVTGMNPSEPPYEIRPITEINPALSTGLEKIILKCTQNNPADRYQTCEELMYDLEHYKDFEDEHIRQQKNKFRLFIGSCVLTLLFAIVSVWGYFSAENAKRENYDQILAEADSIAEFNEAIGIDPTRTDAYLGTDDYDGIIDYIISDGTLEADEISALTKLKSGIEVKDNQGYSKTVYPLEQLKENDSKAYEEVCYKIGEAFLFYYDIEGKDKYKQAATWFKDCGDDYPDAKIYCTMSECLQNIDKFESKDQTANLAEAYGALWTELGKLQNSTADLNDDIKIEVWGEIVTLINTHPAEFSEVASASEINELLNSISNDLDDISSTFLENKIAALENDIELTLTKINAAANN